mmetsp:Transcript_76779/g.220497  ORF Transcript_76779/g.220497 Transcript_76779/m.220497 type:complete len:207 (-) Transcript_76779:1889-2509(-)
MHSSSTLTPIRMPASVWAARLERTSWPRWGWKRVRSNERSRLPLRASFKEKRASPTSRLPSSSPLSFLQMRSRPMPTPRPPKGSLRRLSTSRTRRLPSRLSISFRWTSRWRTQRRWEQHSRLRSKRRRKASRMTGPRSNATGLARRPPLPESSSWWARSRSSPRPRRYFMAPPSRSMKSCDRQSWCACVSHRQRTTSCWSGWRRTS